MKRFKVIKDFLSCLKENDIAIFAGEDLSKEAYEYDREGNFYVLDSPGVASSIALGIAMNTKKRVFIFSGDGECLMELGAYAQAAVSRCKNIFCVILDNDSYQAAGGSPTIFRSVTSMTGVLFNFGFLFQNYTKHFTGRTPIKIMTQKIGSLVGPAAILIEVDKGYKKDLKEIDLSKKEIKDRIIKFIGNEELGTSLFVPPYSLDHFDVNLDGGMV